MPPRYPCTGCRAVTLRLSQPRSTETRG
jgi:hypothetical protein